ncbi:preprotein translocase subunit SecG [bacterium]|nr:preprotein translocase subunit SecG [bacterium]
MLTTFVAIHVLICLFMIGIILLQVSQQANIGSMFGGGASQTVFGSGTQTALGKATTVGAILFFCTCLLISFIIEKERSVIKHSAVIQEQIEEKVAPKDDASSPSAAPGLPDAAQEVPSPAPASPAPDAP